MNLHRPRHLRRTAGPALALLAAMALTLTACGSDDSGSSGGSGGSSADSGEATGSDDTGTGTGTDADSDEAADADDPATVTGEADPEAGIVVDNAFVKPEITLTDTDGEPFDLVADTAGYTTLLYFGYTNCPDVCPLTMSNIAVAAEELTDEQREKLRVVMITSDPERDTPEELGSWLRGQSPDFIGLSGDFEEIKVAARKVGVHLDEPVVEEDGSVVSTHGTQVIAFLPQDDLGHVLYTKNATVDTFERDLPKLIEGQTP